MADKKTVAVEALQYHTYNGKEYQVGDTYEIASDLVDSVTAQGKAARVDRVAHAKEQADAAEQARQARAHPVDVMGTDTFGKGY